ncbi:HNH endonuclease [Mycolicibacillus parakoreensis]|uniref:HNH endonuclease n=1 Tax=Mycolicibacillus parakoreensis TaxID=1069221 RepID=A0ABY3TZG6_9MYCO|nr:HNH endonuclease [Mycolicibacillus parakoreensis]MCV7315805.1 HNH endonuclease [Mycolicibacillus parakoreensis]ULN51771.1 HNH endonuclease [Mycolicibacillus parakoreensis]
MTFACGPHHRLITPTGWRTRKNHAGDTGWIPPPRTDRPGPRTNTFHHPEKLLHRDNDGDDPDAA